MQIVELLSIPPVVIASLRTRQEKCNVLLQQFLSFLMANHHASLTTFEELMH